MSTRRTLPALCAAAHRYRAECERLRPAIQRRTADRPTDDRFIVNTGRVGRGRGHRPRLLPG